MAKDLIETKEDKEARRLKKKLKKEKKAKAKDEAEENGMDVDGQDEGKTAVNGNEGAKEGEGKVKDKKKKKEKKRKAEAEGEAEPESLANGDAKDTMPKKKKAKKSLDAEVSSEVAIDPVAEETPSSATLPPTSVALNGAPSASPADISEFLSANVVSYDPPTATNTYPPVLSFEALRVHDDLRKSLGGFKKPTPIQSASWPVLLKGKDVIGIAETGSGKTMGFGIPACQYILSLPTSTSKPSKKSRKPPNPVSVLVVAPTRELAMQTHVQLQQLGTHTSPPILSVCIYGGVPKPPQYDELAKGPRIVVGTPGRVLDLVNEERLDLSSVGWLVLDEADRMLDKGFENEVRNIISRCLPSPTSPIEPPTEGPSKFRQTAMFSATWPMSVRNLAADFMWDPIRVTIGTDELTASTSVSQEVKVLDDGRKKDFELLGALRSNGFNPGKGGVGSGKGQGRDKVLVFALYKKEAVRVETFLRGKGFEVCCIQGDMTQDRRTKSLDDFKEGRMNVLVATDVAARGLDIPKVELVINYTFPLTIEDYIHRIGRTGRAGRTGKSVTFFTDNDKAHAGELMRVLKDANQSVPESLTQFGGAIKKKSHAAYGDHYKEVDLTKKATKIKFD